LIALLDSEGYLEVAVVNGSGAKATTSQVGDAGEVVFK
jgi:S-adenosylmethionine hydrolase